jgi:hypothetical protein
MRTLGAFEPTTRHKPDMSKIAANEDLIMTGDVVPGLTWPGLLLKSRMCDVNEEAEREREAISLLSGRAPGRIARAGYPQRGRGGGGGGG